MIKTLNCITIGDKKGIGLQLIFKIWKKHRNKTGTFFILGNYKVIDNIAKKSNLKIPLFKINEPKESHKYFKNFIPILNIDSINEKYNSLDSIKKSYEYAKNKLVTSIVTLPINKDKLNSIDKDFIDHTEYFQKIDKNISNMLFLSKKIIVTPITGHIPINQINNKINKSLLRNKINSLLKTLKYDLNIKNIKIAVSGLNPHSGENGIIGNKEEKIIKPIINEFKRKGIKIYGPMPGDTIFLPSNLNKYDCFITMFHDQALIAFKLLSFDKGVNFTAGLNVIRTSPCHGTAYDIASKNTASELSLYNSIIYSNKIYINRNGNKKIAWSKFFN